MTITIKELPVRTAPNIIFEKSKVRAVTKVASEIDNAKQGIK